MQIYTDITPLAEWAASATLPIPHVLIHAYSSPIAHAAIALCKKFAANLPPAAEALIIIIMTQPSAADEFQDHAGVAALWSFTQQAALHWAPRGIRVNAIGLGVSPAGPFEAWEQAGRTAGPAPAVSVNLADIVRSVEAIASWPSMTGQIIRLG